ncbi:DUF2252 family protein [Rhizobium tubonense]|uniref:DUF2252 domain-containing protein n=1 Tax=Rhizobium tubonense TaxID=484088 RepID=A0A2W4ECL8_9HYPH|nr:DUF2252 family protein [Rhizobium tubonense]PZM12246.1 hypothetical protein CPY51_19355 [Rhizobium tubonense]
MTRFSQSIAAYESWLRAELGTDLSIAGLDKKHQKMKTGSFAFLRATYWRWAETILDLCPALAGAPAVLAIGDTHLENFGTWRDGEGRLVWGANDFDDAAVMPYALDLVRLAASAMLARSKGGLSAEVVGGAILGGYRRGLAQPLPIILERDHKWLRNAVLLPDAERKKFWEKFQQLPQPLVPPAAKYVDALRGCLPDPALPFVARPRTAGTGSLGRPRFVAYVEWRGGPVLREAKALAQSAWSLRHDPANKAIQAEAIAAGRSRSPDPQYKVANGVLVRRLSPNSRKIEVDGDADLLLSPDMLDLMGFEIANCHSSDPARIPAIMADIEKRPLDWLSDAAKAAAMSIAIEQKAYAATG